MDNIVDLEETVIGCEGVCPFSGARCDNDEGNHHMGQHSTIHQRPLAWAGCFEIVDDRKYLISEICQSEKILENSMWAESSEYPP